MKLRKTCVALIIFFIGCSFTSTISAKEAASATETYQLGDNVVGVLEVNGTLTISGTGEMYDYSTDISPLFNDYSIQYVVVEEGVTYIGEGTFTSCKLLESVDIAGSVKKIGSDAFAWCTGLRSVELSEGIEEVGDWAFARCSNLHRVEFANSIKIIDDYAFYGCFALQELVLPTSLESVGTHAFGGCIEITELVIPASVTKLNNAVFGACPNIMDDKEYALTSINVAADNKTYKSIDGVVYSYDGKGLIWYPEGRRESKYVVPDGVRRIGEYSFSNKYLESVELPNTVVVIDDIAFEGCSALKNINFLEGLENIGVRAFEGCSALDNVVIPKSLRLISSRAFANCTELHNVTFLSYNAYIGRELINNGAISNYIFENCPEDLKVQLHKGSTMDEYMDEYAGGNREYLELHAESILLNVETATLEIKDTIQLTATIYPDISTDSLVWNTSDNNIATVDQNGLVTAVGIGEAVITAQTLDGCEISASCAVTVQEEQILVEKIIISESKIELTEGSSYTLTIEVGPENATNKKLNWFSHDESIATVDENGRVTAIKEGTTYIFANTTDGSNIFTGCTVTVTKPIEDGLHQDEDGTWYYYLDGEIAAEYTGLVEYYGSWYYVENGILNWNYTGLTCYYGTWYYVEGGVLNWNYTGLTCYYDTWYYVEGGVLNWNYTGLCEYYGSWYYVEGGMLNWGYTGLTYYYDTWYYVEGGVLNWGYTGLVYHYGTWYYVEGGVLNWNYTGLCYHYGTWYYVEGGVLNWNYTGLVYHYGTWYYVADGVLDWNFTGTVYYNGSWWYVKNGIMVGAA